MPTNQTIDGVPRELLEQLVDPVNHISRVKARAQLRALLDAQHAVCSNGILCQNSNCQECGGNGAYKPAAQPQGEPVEIGYIEHSREFESEFAPVINRLIWTMPPDQRHKIPQRYKVMLYAEQPAPVAVVMPERAPNEEAGEAWDCGYNACLDEVKRLNP